MLFGSVASRFRLSRPCLAASRSAGSENNDTDDGRPIIGRGMISDILWLARRGLLFVAIEETGT